MKPMSKHPFFLISDLNAKLSRDRKKIIVRSWGEMLCHREAVVPTSWYIDVYTMVCPARGL